MADPMPAALDPSVLGTKAHWDEAYSVELSNHTENPANEGAIWFEDTGAEERMIEYMKSLPLDQKWNAEVEDESQQRILDLGTGNGHLLFELREEGFTSQLLGIDYSERSILLARQVQEARRAPALREDSQYAIGPERISFEVWDLLQDDEPSWLHDGFDVVLDKGTFDAISLSDIKDQNGKAGWESYSTRVRNFIKSDSYLLVTSCNWTNEELIKWIEIPGLVVHQVIKYPSFTFGGIKGQSVSTVCFKRTTTRRKTE